MVDDSRTGELFPDITEIRAAAVRYAEEGYDVHRINLNTRTGLPGKRPTYGRKEDGNTWPHVTHAPADFRPGDNLGAKCGKPSGFLAVGDMDCPEAAQIAPHVMPPTRTIGHHNQPTHYYYISDVGGKGAWELKGEGKLVELLSDGQQVVMPPSVWSPDKDSDTRTQDHYRVICDRPVAKVDPDELKRRLRIVAGGAYLLRYFPPAGVGILHDISNAIAGIFAHYGHQQGYTEEHAKLLKNAVWTVAGGDMVTALSNVRTAFAADRPTREGSLRSHEHDPQAPTLHALPQGFTKNFVKLLGITLEHQSTRGGTPQNDSPTHDELRDRWQEKHPNFVFGQQEWKQYQNGLYTPVEDFVVKQGIADVIEEAKSEGVRPTASLLSSVYQMGQVKASVRSDLFDADPDLLVCENGILEISTGKLYEHTPKLYATTGVPYAFDPDATCEAWEGYAASTLGDFHDFLQEFAGYCLTTDTELETAVWLYGDPGSGKSTFIEGIKTMLGPGRWANLGLADIVRSQFGLGNVPGKTALIATEQPAQFLESTATLDALISGEELTAELKYRDAFTFKPVAKIIWAMNNLPRVQHANSGLFRRVKVVQFPAPLDEKDRNEDLKTLIRMEGSGILNWALRGLLRLQQRGRFDIPESVANPTRQFATANDRPQLFFDECCEKVDDLNVTVRGGKLFKVYRAWCSDNNFTAVGSDKFLEAMTTRVKLKHTKPGNKSTYHGVKIDPEWEDRGF